MSEQSSDDTEREHERGQRHGQVETCDYDGCDSTEFNVVRDELTKHRLIVCVSCGFTMGWIERSLASATEQGGSDE